MPLFERFTNNLKMALGLGGDIDDTDDIDNIDRNGIIKQMRRVSETMWDTDGDKEYEIEYSFMISEDFVRVKSHAAEADLLLVYSPGVSEPWNVSPESKPYVFVSTGDGRVFELGEQFREKGKTEGFIKKVNIGKFRFVCLAEYYGDLIYLYGGDLGETMESCGLAAVYPKSLKGTKEEKIIKAAVDNAAATYSEKYTERTGG
ncbi:MAG: hypothetical protein NC078_01075 [Ruminococcus sp.]|nr:hypothetical protein [Ruminococcus sp.]